MPRLRDLISQRFGRLIAICPIEKRVGGNVVWLCRCDCGNLVNIVSFSLPNGNTKSCGCLQKEVKKQMHITHGDRINKKQTPLYTTWIAMKARCYNLKNNRYKYYGGREISICDEWKKDYSIFKTWALQNKHEERLTIDRINNDGNYTPNNCQWLTKSENAKKARAKRIGI